MKTRRFVDTVHVFARAGRGGNGCVSFRREKFVPHGGPNGGDGGRGGHVTLRADPEVDSLQRLFFQPHIIAERGEHGRGKDQHGRNGKDLVVAVPCGTEVWDDTSGQLLADLLKAGDEILVAKGGSGGLGNIHFQTSTHQAPTEHTDGAEGEERGLRLVLKMVAQAGLVGFPNAGKSSILRRISHAQPKVAPYPFTTINPIVGTVTYEDYSSIRVADIPGLIRDAHKGVGLGDDFLRHVERAGILIHVVDMGASEGRDPVQDYRDVRRELSLYREDLSRRPTLVVANKMDLPGAAEQLKRFKRDTRTKPLPISAETGEGIDDLKVKLREMIGAPKDWKAPA